MDAQPDDKADRSPGVTGETTRDPHPRPRTIATISRTLISDSTGVHQTVSKKKVGVFFQFSRKPLTADKTRSNFIKNMKSSFNFFVLDGKTVCLCYRTSSRSMVFTKTCLFLLTYFFRLIIQQYSIGYDILQHNESRHPPVWIRCSMKYPIQYQIIIL